jgi:hypothetical protein
VTDDGESNTSDDPAYGVEPLSFDEFLESFGRVERDEDLVDMTGSGMDVEIPDNPEEQALSDMLSTWRTNVESKPMPKSIENIGENMSVHENANKLAAIGGRTASSGMVEQLLEQLGNDQAEAVAAAGVGSAEGDDVNRAFEEAKAQISAAYQNVLAAYQFVQELGTRHGGSA